MRFREIEKIILKDGWYLVVVSCSHYQYKHPSKPRRVTVPNHRGDGDIPLRVVSSRLVSHEAGLYFLPKGDTMKYIYPAIFYPEEDNRFSVIFPDLNNLATYGDTLADAFAMAQDACEQYLFTLLHDGEPLPNATALGDVVKDEPDAIVNLICADLDAYSRAYDDRAVKKTLSIPAWLNTLCDSYGINYSKVLKDALIAKLQTQP